MKEETPFIFKFSSYADALTWDAFEVIFWIGIIMVLFFIVTPIEVAVIAQMVGMVTALGIWAKVISKNIDPKNYGKNCWHDPD